MEKQSKKTVLLIGLTLFSMFFGAGNLIFPPILGAQAQGATVIAMIGFCITAICFPILGVIVVNKSDGIKNLANRVNPVFSKILVFLIYLSIGPMLAIPRTASTSFEIAALPFLPENSNIILWRVIYSVLFFGVAFLVALRPDKLTDRLGKILCPCLLTLIAVVFIGSLFAPTNQLLEPALKYQDIAFVSGFLDGYQTMDTLAALNFGAIIALNIKAKGIKDKKSTHSLIIKSGIIAGVLLLIVYAILSFIGVKAGAPDATNGAQVLTVMVHSLFGKPGLIILAGIFVIACFNICVSLFCCCSEYFNSIFPKIRYKIWVMFFAVISMIVANAGLDTIISISVPILNAIYPVAIVLIVLSLFNSLIKDNKLVYSISIYITAFMGVAHAVYSLNVATNFFNSTFVKFVPLFSIGMGWIIPAVIGVAIGILLSLGKKKAK